MGGDILALEGKERDDLRIVVSAMILDEGRLLLIKRGESPRRGYYSFPEGHLKVGEGIAEGIKRECLEEIGCSVAPLNSKVLMLEGPTNSLLPDDYLEKSWPPREVFVGQHHYVVFNSIPMNVEEPVNKDHKKYFYIPCALLGKPKTTAAALEITYMSLEEALELRGRRAIKLVPTTSVALALLKLSVL
ncbi:MAG: NUDIX domain-containing protein [Candidatus Nezhaarchaeota archaeon]|nr:NUDIX domain-containing protein [Candidatus Nezhaarchaeota archaeon]